MLCHCRKTKRNAGKGRQSGGSKSHVLLSGEVFDFMLPLPYSGAHYVVHIVFCYL